MPHTSNESYDHAIINLFQTTLDRLYAPVALENGDTQAKGSGFVTGFIAD
jgi:hypothetical protein